MVEGVTATLALFAIGGYILGLITVNVHLSSIGMSDFGLLRARYVYTGALVIAYILLVCVWVTSWFWLPTVDMPMLLYVLVLLVIGVIPGVIGILSPWADSSDISQQAERPWWSRSPLMFYLVRLVLFYVAIVLGFLTGVSVFILWIVARKNPLAEGQVPNFVEPMFEAWVKWWDDPLQDAERWTWFAFGSIVFLLIFGVFFVIFVKTYYPHIPEMLGGGKPKSAQLLIAPEGQEGARQLGIPMPECTTPDNKAQLSEEVSILFEGVNIYALRLPNNAVIQIDKKLVIGARLMGRSGPLKQSLARAPQSQES